MPQSTEQNKRKEACTTMFYRRGKNELNDEEDNKLSEYELLTKCLKEIKNVYKLLGEIKETIERQTTGEIKELKEERLEDKKFLHEVIMQVLKKPTAAESYAAAKAANSNVSSSTLSVKEQQRGDRPKLPG